MTFVEEAMPAGLAQAVLGERQARTLVFGILAEIAAVATILIPLYGHSSSDAPLYAALAGLIAAGLAAAAFWTWRYLQQDLAVRKVISVTGTIGLLDVGYPSYPTRGRYSELWLGPVNLRIDDKLADQLRRVATRKDNRLSFAGTVRYLPHSRMLLSILADPSGLIFEHRAMAAFHRQTKSGVLSPDGWWRWDGIGWAPVSIRPAVSVMVPLAVALIVVLGLPGLTYLSGLFGGPADLNCIGQSNAVAPHSSADGTTRFEGSDSPDSLYYTAPFAMDGHWSISWDAAPGQLTILLFDASAKAPWHSPWNPLRDNDTGYLDSPLNHNWNQASPYHGTAVESRSGKFCMTVAADGAWMITITNL